MGVNPTHPSHGQVVWNHVSPCDFSEGCTFMGFAPALPLKRTMVIVLSNRMAQIGLRVWPAIYESPGSSVSTHLHTERLLSSTVLSHHHTSSAIHSGMNLSANSTVMKIYSHAHWQFIIQFVETLGGHLFQLTTMNVLCRRVWLYGYHRLEEGFANLRSSRVSHRYC